MELYQAGRFKLDESISNRYSLDRINEAIADAEKGESLRNVIMFQVEGRNIRSIELIVMSEIQ